MINATQPAQEAAVTPGRAFLRGLNLLLKSARLYGLDHRQLGAQIESVWEQLRAVWTRGNKSDFTVGVADSALLINGVHVEATPTEQSLVHMLTAADLTSIQFSPSVTREEFFRFVRAFAEGSSKLAGLADRLRIALGQKSNSSIRVNEIRFVAKSTGEPDADPDADLAGARVAASLLASALPGEAGKLLDSLNDPVRLLQFLAAAQGAAPNAAAYPAGIFPAGGQAAGAPPSTDAAQPVAEDDLMRVLQLLVQWGQASQKRSPAVAAVPFQQQLGRLPANARETLRDALTSIASAPAQNSDSPLLVRLAEQLAIRFALERYESGDMRINRIHQLIEKMSAEISTLRKVLHSQEEFMSRVGITVESHAEILDRQFWNAVPASGKRSVLLSSEAWCIPPRNIRQFLQEVVHGGDKATAEAILQHYAACVHGPDAEGRRKAAAGVLELADLYATSGAGLLDLAMSEVGKRLGEEREPESQRLLGDAFIRLCQEAADRRCYRNVQQALETLQGLEKERPAWIDALRSRIRVEKRLPEFIEESLRAPQIPGDLVNLLQAMPGPAAEQLAGRLVRCARHRERERLVALAQELGAPCAEQLRRILATYPTSEGLAAIGLLSRVEPAALVELLPAVLRESGRAIQDAALRQLSVAGAIERGGLLLNILDLLEPSVRPRAIEEIGLCNDPASAARLLLLIEGVPPAADTPYLRVKVMEVLGQLRQDVAAPLLRERAEARRLLAWAYPKEERIVAAQALAKIDPGWVEEFLPHSGLEPAELACGPLDPAPDAPTVRQRYYQRVRPPSPLRAVVVTPEGKYQVNIVKLSLGGGMLDCAQQRFPLGEARLKIQTGLRPIEAAVVLHMFGSQQAWYEIIDWKLEERYKLRRLLMSVAPTAPALKPTPVGTAA